MILVEALDTYERLNITDEEQKEVPKKGKQFKVSKERLEVLLGKNKYNKAFVKIVDENKTETKKAIKPKKNITKRNK